MKPIFLVCLVAAAVLCGCATPTGCGSAPQRLTFARPFDTVWAVVVDELTNSCDLAVSNPLMGEIRTERVTIGYGQDGAARLHEFACEPSAILEEWTQAEVMAFVRVLRAGDAKTTVELRCEFYSFESNVRDAWYRWPSKGNFERQFLIRVMDRLREPARIAAAE